MTSTCDRPSRWHTSMWGINLDECIDWIFWGFVLVIWPVWLGSVPAVHGLSPGPGYATSVCVWSRNRTARRHLTVLNHTGKCTQRESCSHFNYQPGIFSPLVISLSALWEFDHQCNITQFLQPVHTEHGGGGGDRRGRGPCLCSAWRHGLVSQRRIRV